MRSANSGADCDYDYGIFWNTWPIPGTLDSPIPAGSSTDKLEALDS